LDITVEKKIDKKKGKKNHLKKTPTKGPPGKKEGQEASLKDGKKGSRTECLRQKTGSSDQETGHKEFVINRRDKREILRTSEAERDTNLTGLEMGE